MFDRRSCVSTTTLNRFIPASSHSSAISSPSLSTTATTVEPFHCWHHERHPSLHSIWHFVLLHDILHFVSPATSLYWCSTFLLCSKWHIYFNICLYRWLHSFSQHITKYVNKLWLYLGILCPLYTLQLWVSVLFYHPSQYLMWFSRL